MACPECKKGELVQVESGIKKLNDFWLYCCTNCGKVFGVKELEVS